MARVFDGAKRNTYCHWFDYSVEIRVVDVSTALRNKGIQSSR